MGIEEGISLRVKTLTILVLVLSLGAMAISAHPDLTSTTFGFPVATQSGITTSFNQDNTNVSDMESLNTGLPIEYTGLKMGPPQAGKIHLLGFNFNSLSGDAFYNQASNQALNSDSTSFTQSSEGSNFAYPFTGIGIVSMPGLGLSL